MSNETSLLGYALGQEVQLQGQFFNASAALANPDTVTLFVRLPDKVTVTQYTLASGVVHAATGIFYYNLVLSSPGEWLYCWEGTGAVQAATYDIPIQVAPSALRST